LDVWPASLVFVSVDDAAGAVPSPDPPEPSRLEPPALLDDDARESVL
jgi:hypothetical protein